MRVVATVALFLAGWMAMSPEPAAQNAAQSAVARELERKARAGEPDNGFCLREAPLRSDKCQPCPRTPASYVSGPYILGGGG